MAVWFSNWKMTALSVLSVHYCYSHLPSLYCFLLILKIALRGSALPSCQYSCAAEITIMLIFKKLEELYEKS